MKPPTLAVYKFTADLDFLLAEAGACIFPNHYSPDREAIFDSVYKL